LGAFIRECLKLGFSGGTSVVVLQDPFDVDEFVERLAWRTTRNTVNFDPLRLHSAFEKTIRDLKEMNMSVMKQVEQLEVECNDEEKAHWQRVSKLHEHNQVSTNLLFLLAE